MLAGESKTICYLEKREKTESKVLESMKHASKKSNREKKLKRKIFVRKMRE